MIRDAIIGVHARLFKLWWALFVVMLIGGLVVTSPRLLVFIRDGTVDLSIEGLWQFYRNIYIVLIIGGVKLAVFLQVSLFLLFCIYALFTSKGVGASYVRYWRHINRKKCDETPIAQPPFM